MGKGRSKKETQSGRPREHSKKHWYIRQVINAGMFHYVPKPELEYLSPKEKREMKILKRQKHYKRRRYRGHANRDNKNIKANEKRKKKGDKVKKIVMMKKKTKKKSLLDMGGKH